MCEEIVYCQTEGMAPNYHFHMERENCMIHVMWSRHGIQILRWRKKQSPYCSLFKLMSNKVRLLNFVDKNCSSAASKDTKMLLYSTKPQSAIIISTSGLSDAFFGTSSIFLTISIPSVTSPKTTCFPSKCGVSRLVMKNWLPFVPGPGESRTVKMIVVRNYSNNRNNSYSHNIILTSIGHGELSKSNEDDWC